MEQFFILCCESLVLKEEENEIIFIYEHLFSSFALLQQKENFGHLKELRLCQVFESAMSNSGISQVTLSLKFSTLFQPKLTPCLSTPVGTARLTGENAKLSEKFFRG